MKYEFMSSRLSECVDWARRRHGNFYVVFYPPRGQYMVVRGGE